MKFVSEKFPELTFYVDGVQKKFQQGVYETADKEEVAVLKQLTDAKEVKAEAKKPAKSTASEK